MSHLIFDAHQEPDLLEKYSCKGGLQSAAMLGATMPVSALIKKGHRYTDVNDFGNNAAHIASFAEQKEFLKKIPERELNQCKNAQNHDMETPLMVAINEYSKNVAQFWLKNDVDLSLTNKQGHDAYDLAEQTGQYDLLHQISDQDTTFRMS